MDTDKIVVLARSHSFIQIIVFSLVVAYGLSTFRALGLPKPLLILVCLLISIVPLNGMMLITLWKDILYGISVLLLNIYLLKTISSNGIWLSQGWNYVWLGSVAANITLLRHNGFPVAFGTLLVTFLFFRAWKPLIKALVISLVWIGIVMGPVYSIFKVDMTDTQPLGVVLIHPLAAHVRAGTPLTPDDKAYLDRIRPLQNGWSYSCYDATVLFYQGVNFQPVQEDPIYAAKLLARLTLDSPLVTLKHFACLSTFVWSPFQPKGVSLETIYLKNQDISINLDWEPYDRIVNQNSKLPWLKDIITGIIQKDSQIDTGKIFWRPAIYLFLFMISVLYNAFRKKKWLIALLIAPIIFQSLIIAVSAQLQALRYQYPVYLVSLLFTIPFFYLSIAFPNPNEGYIDSKGNED